MWLLRAVPLVASLAVRVYYRFEVTGPALPRVGPALLLANHPNALLDPAAVVTAVRRAVRFLAKATLFDVPVVGSLVRAAGAIPVYRRMDDPSVVGRNVESFAAVFEALAEGAAVGIFPEGLSHGEPALAPLKTGAARMALGFAARHGGRTLPVVPVGLVYRHKTRFRSEMLAIRGEAIDWSDLAGRDPGDPVAIAEMTSRLDSGLRRVTVNLDSWEDRPLVEGAEAVWAAERGAPDDPGLRVARIERTTAVLTAVRRGWGGGAGNDLARRIVAHVGRLRRIGLAPDDLASADEGGVDRGLRRAAFRLGALLPLWLALAAAGWALFWIPYRLTGWLADLSPTDPVMRSTRRVLTGAALYVLWVAALAAAAALAWNGWAGLAALALVPAVGMAGLVVRERWRGAWRDLRRLLPLRSRARLLAGLREDQRGLARELDALHAAWAAHEEKEGSGPDYS